MSTAKKAIKRLFEWCPLPDVGDDEVYLAGAVGIFSEYPVAVMEKLANPITGTQYLPDRPSLRTLRLACDEVFAPIARAQTRDNIRALALLEHHPGKLTDEQRRHRAEQVVRLKEIIKETLAPEPVGPDAIVRKAQAMLKQSQSQPQE
jgi:hypothetical protein